MKFDKWLQIHTNLSDEKYEKIMNILDIYQNLDKELKNYPYFAIRSDRIDKEKLFRLLEKERFVFVQVRYIVNIFLVIYVNEIKYINLEYKFYT